MQNELVRQLEEWQKCLKESRFRGLMFVCNASHLITQYFKTNNQSLQLPVPYSSSFKVNQVLGNEQECIIFDARYNFDSNLFAASCGTLMGGGSLILLLPKSFEALFKGIDPQNIKYNEFKFDIDENNNQIQSSSYAGNESYSPLLIRLLLNGLNHSITAKLVSDEYTFDLKNLKQTSQPETSPATSYQNSVIEKIIKVATGRSKRPLVLSANRGRGKSAALGIAASALIDSGPIKLIVTAPLKANLASFYKHFSPKTKSDINGDFSNGSQLRYFPVDTLLQQKPIADLVLIDEAAAIPVTLLEQLSCNYNRLVFATTNYGYEGNGKGFEVRFQQTLVKRYPQTKFAHLEQPIRWRNDDKLEKCINQSLLLDCELPVLSKNIIDHNKVTFKEITKQKLQNSNQLLASIFALLINAHYQTRPADLEQMLINPNIIVFAAFQYQELIGVSLIVKEGSLSQTIISQCLGGRKPLKGNLLPQSIIAHQGAEIAGKLQFYRIMRIAVHPDIQRQNLGTQMLKHLHHVSQQKNIDLIGASFANDDATLSFWLNSGYQLSRFGSAKDSSSGAITAEVLLANSQPAKKLVNQLNLNFCKALEYKLSGELKTLPSSCLLLLLTSQRNFNFPSPETSEIAELKRFTQGSRGVSMIDWQLNKLLKHYLSTHHISELNNQENKQFIATDRLLLLIDAVIFQHSKEKIIKKHKLSGKKSYTEKLREITQSLLSYYETD